MKPLPVLLLVWLSSGVGAFVGSILGNGLGRTGLMAGAVVGGLVASAAGVDVATRLDWLPRTGRQAAAVGAMVGFIVAAAVAMATLHTPIIPIAVASLSGVGALLGAGMARGGAAAV